VLNLQVLKGCRSGSTSSERRASRSSVITLASLPTQLEPAKYERMIFGLILVLMMIFPSGIFPARRRQRELGER